MDAKQQDIEDGVAFVRQAHAHMMKAAEGLRAVIMEMGDEKIKANCERSIAFTERLGEVLEQLVREGWESNLVAGGLARGYFESLEKIYTVARDAEQAN